MKILHIGLLAGKYPLHGLQKALMTLGKYAEIYTGEAGIEFLIKQKSNIFKPDLVFIQAHREGIISIEAIKELRKNGAFVINWSGDVREPLPLWYYEIGEHVDLTTFSNMNDIETIKLFNIKSDFLDVGYNEEIYTSTGKIFLDAPEIVFMANNYEHFPLSGFRKELINFLKEHYKNNFGLYGAGWPYANGSFMDAEQDEAAMYRSCKIAINCSNFERDRYSSDRILRIMGCGTLCLCKWFPGIEIDYIDGKDLIIWRDFAELKKKIDYYLRNIKKGNKIAKQGNRTVLRKHTFKRMAKNILKLYDKHSD